MSKKGKGAGKKKPARDDKEVLQEVDKEFYEIQITDLNQKLARLRSHCTELEAENEDARKNLQKLDEDRADIIAYLKRTLQAKSDEVTELQEQLASLQQSKDAERAMFLEKIKTMEHDFKSMHEQLNSEIKLLNGKLNSLEEFRRERDELMQKFQNLEDEMEEQEKRHKITLYEVERKFIIGKDELKKDMENKLLQLSLDFQNTTDIRIATTTHRVIRENVAINNEINVLMESWKNLYDENNDLKKKEKELKIEAEMQRDENKIVLRKNKIQNRIIEKISSEHVLMKSAYDEMTQLRQINVTLEKDLDGAQTEMRNWTAECSRLKQALHSRAVEECVHEGELASLREHCRELERLVATATETVREGLKSQEEPNEDEAYNLSKREALLSALVELFENPEAHVPGATQQPAPTPTQSVDTVSCYRMNMFKTGDPVSKTSLSGSSKDEKPDVWSKDKDSDKSESKKEGKFEPKKTKKSVIIRRKPSHKQRMSVLSENSQE